MTSRTSSRLRACWGCDSLCEMMHRLCIKVFCPTEACLVERELLLAILFYSTQTAVEHARRVVAPTRSRNRGQPFLSLHLVIVLCNCWCIQHLRRKSGGHRGIRKCTSQGNKPFT